MFSIRNRRENHAEVKIVPRKPNPASEGKNELTVIADNSAVPNTRRYSGSGICK